ncbi:nucleotidyltransferase domain-containing protein [Patescibacteria group bacterium]|nr:nucleotidyltransferase domain-containing protein [Patescibacteria group bacterium]
MTTYYQKEIKNITEQITKRYKPKKIILYGSFAYGKPHKDSDVDLFVIKETKKKRTERHLELDKILSDRNIPLDILVYTSKEVEQKLALKDLFIKKIMDQGKVIYAR